MKKLLGILVAISTLFTVSNAEMLTGKNHKIKYTLSTDEDINYKFILKSPQDECKVGLSVFNEDDKL